MQFHKNILPLTLALTVLLGYNFMYAQWSNPPGAAPSGNVEAPINTSATSQIKLGPLGIGPLSVSGHMSMLSTNPLFYLNDTDGTPFWLYNNNSVFYILTSRDGDSSTIEWPYPMTMSVDPNSANDYVHFSNQVRAAAYCDQGGANCSTAAQLSASTNIASNSVYSGTNQISGLTAGKKYLIFFNGWDSNTAGGRVEDCVGNLLIATPENPSTDRNFTGSHLLNVTAPASGCIRAFTRGSSRSPAYYVTVL
jgi:hypothetical protein